MSDTLDRLRRLHGLREQKHEDAERSLPSSAPAGAAGRASTGSSFQPLPQAVPGAQMETEAGLCYVSTHAYPLAIPRGDHALGALLEQPPGVIDELYTSGVRAAASAGESFDYSRAVFIDTETSGLGSGSCCFMIGVGTFEALDTASSPFDRAATIDNTGYVGDINDDINDPDAFALLPTSHAERIYVPRAPISPQAATHFVVRQYFMRHAGEETALLAAVAGALAPYTMTVTFNGRAFDLPLLRSRFRLHRHFLPASTPPPDLLDERRIHLDLLPPARRLWRRRLQSCRLINLEQKILNLHRSEDDVPGHLIPMLYVDFTRSGDARAMRQVFYHNREDIVSMVGIAAHLTATITSATSTSTASTSTANTSTASTSVTSASTGASPPAREADVQPGPNAPALHGHEWLALGLHYVKEGRHDEAVTALQRATETLTNPQDRALALGELAALYKRTSAWERACETWQLWISSIPGHNPTPYIELAKYNEWQLRDLAQAEMWTAWALHNLQQADRRSQYRAQIGELQHRLQRIQRKRAPK